MHSIQWSECNALTMMYTCQCIEYNAQNPMHCIMKHIIHWQKYKTIYIAMYRIEHKEYNAYNIMHKYNALNTMHRIQCIEYSA